MRQTLTAVFDDRDKAQQALAELLACGYLPADAVPTTIAGERSALSHAAPAPAWRERPGASGARMLAWLLGQPDSRQVPHAPRPCAPDSHVLTLSTHSVREVERAVGVISGFMIGGDVSEPVLPAARRTGLGFPHTGPRTGGAAQAAYRFGQDIHNNERYRNRAWKEASADLRVLWEARSPRVPGWEGSEAEVRLGWDSTSPEIDDDSYYRSHWRTRHAPATTSAGAAGNSGSAASGSAPGNTPARRRRIGPTAWEHFMDAIRHGWSRTVIGNDMDEDDYRLHRARKTPVRATTTSPRPIATAVSCAAEQCSLDVDGTRWSMPCEPNGSAVTGRTSRRPGTR